MKIDVRNIKTYGKLIAKFVDAGHPQYSSLYLDFGNGRVYFGSNRGFGAVTMSVTDADPEIKPFCVNALSFIAVAEAVPILDVERREQEKGKVKYVFRHEDGDSFQIAHNDLEDFNYPAFDVDFSDAVSLNQELIPAIRRASAFTSPDGAKNLDGVFIRGGRVYGIDKFRMYEESVEGADGENLALPRNVWEILVLENLAEPKIKIDENCIWIVSEDVTLQFPLNLELFLPEEVGTAEFKAKYAHPHCVRLDKNSLGGMIQFFLPFVSDVVQQRLQFIFNEGGLEIKTEDGNVISRHVPYADSEKDGYFNGQRIWASAQWVKTILSCLPNAKDAVVRIAVNFDVAPLVFSVDGDDSVHIVYSRIKDGA